MMPFLVAPATPPRQTSSCKRHVSKTLSDPKEVNTKRLRRFVESADPAEKPKDVMAPATQRRAKTPEHHVSDGARDFSACLDEHGVSSSSRTRLLPILQRWGPARAQQILGLWSFLGDGESRPISTPSLQVWGPAGTGKTAIVHDFLHSCGIRFITLNCACFTSRGEVHARIVELLRRQAVCIAEDVCDLPATMLQAPPVGRQLRALDKFETAIRKPLSQIARADETLSEERRAHQSWKETKIVIVLDHAQELPRLGPDTVEFVVTLPQVLHCGSQLAMVALSRLPLSRVGLLPAREPPAVAFNSYTQEEAKILLARTLAETPVREWQEVNTNLAAGFIQFATPQLGTNLQSLKGVAMEVMHNAARGTTAGAKCAALQEEIEQAVHKRVGLCSLRGFLEPNVVDSVEYKDPVTASAHATLRKMTNAEKRLVVAALLAAHVDKDLDGYLFVPSRKNRRKPLSKQQDLDISVRQPQPTSLSRLFAIYHRLAGQSQMLGPALFEDLVGLKSTGLIRFVGNANCSDQDAKVTCRVDLSLARACARDLGLELAEYLVF